MLIKTYCSAVLGVGAIPITIEVFISQGIRFFIVGLADHAIRESQQRIESALSNTGFEWPRFRIVINLSPAHLRKAGTHFDLALAVGILAASKQLRQDRLRDYLILGELSLDGSVMPVKGVLPMVLLARDEGFKGVMVPRENKREASVVKGIKVVDVEKLTAVVAFFNGEQIDSGENEQAGAGPLVLSPPRYASDFSEVKGQASAKRAMLIAASGMHNMLMIGPPGSGKSMMARRLPGIMPPMTMEEALETTRIYSVAGKVGRQGLVSRRPFRMPHHSSSAVSIAGGGSNPVPGELSLAHNGVLFLDELPEFKRSVLELMRQPLEEGEIHISRAAYRVDYPTHFVLVTAMNPCPCGYYNHPVKECNCGPGIIKQYLSRVSGPLLDRIDLHIELIPVPFKNLSETSQVSELGSESMRKRVVRAREIQNRRFEATGTVLSNASMGAALRNEHCKLDAAGSSLLRMAMERLALSARAYDRILKVARTIADLDESEKIHPSHVAEAVNYRSLDREV